MSMGAQAQLTVVDLVFFLRQRLLDAAERRDQEHLAELQNTLVVLQEAAWQSQDRRLAALTEDMIDAARDALMGVEWKSTVPDRTAIEALRAEQAG
jgi:hypothetical protein